WKSKVSYWTLFLPKYCADRSGGASAPALTAPRRSMSTLARCLYVSMKLISSGAHSGYETPDRPEGPERGAFRREWWDHTAGGRPLSQAKAVSPAGPNSHGEESGATTPGVDRAPTGLLSITEESSPPKSSTMAQTSSAMSNRRTIQRQTLGRFRSTLSSATTPSW